MALALMGIAALLLAILIWVVWPFVKGLIPVDQDILVTPNPTPRHGYRVAVTTKFMDGDETVRSYVGDGTVWFDEQRRSRCPTPTEAWLCDVAEGHELDQASG